MNSDIQNAVKILKKGGIVIFPTDTVYGIGCSIKSKDAEDKLYEIKGTPKLQKFPILVSSIDQVKKNAVITAEAEKLIAKYWPGALTIILKNKEDQKSGFRMPDDRIVKYLIKKLGSPIYGTSANFHGESTPKSFRELNPKIVKKSDFVINGECILKEESTVVDVSDSKINILRKGAINLR